MTWTKNGNGNWDYGDGKQLGVPYTFCQIAIEEHRSHFDKERVRYSVVVVGTDMRGYSQDFTLKFFNCRQDAQYFADQLAAFLNQMED